MNESVVAFLMMLLLGSGQTFLTHRSIRQVEINLSKNQNYSNLTPKSTISSSSSSSNSPETTTTTTPNEYICIEISPNLPPCNYNKVENSMVEKETLKQIHAKRKRDIPKSLIVYKIEGCRPSRLPFRYPYCKPEESTSPFAKIQNLRPFKPKEVYKTAPQVFPKINHTDWLEQMKQLQLEHQIKTQFEDKPNASENRIKQRQIFEKYNSNKIWNNIQDGADDEEEEEEVYKEKKRLSNMKKTIHKTQKRIEEDIQEARGLDQELDKLVAELEFPYSRAIPFDPEKLQVARVGSEFPYSKAIPFDAEKLQVARERSIIHPYWKDILYRMQNNYQLPHNFDDYSDELLSSYENNFLYPKRSHHSRKLQSVHNNYINNNNNNNNINNNNNNNIHSKQILSNIINEESTTREKLNRLSSDNWEREKKTFLQKETNYHQKPMRLRKKLQHQSRSSLKDKEHKFHYTNNRIEEIESIGEGKPHYLSRNLRFIEEGREFPYTKAIPFDAEKLAIAAARKSDLSKQAFHSKLSTNSKEHISRKPLAFNAGNNLSPLLFVPYNSRRPSIHHSKNQRKKSS
ncbi:putative uncharacterized protein DDB_G0293878 [Leptopilina boulardi]|uniref:putative uncharacterized protein DDB_G0293878 n=1 Tax=Leptopilina boulardi TaxID=63433 RepID=UPI0021F60F1A|nr:putative uncharacterized protein DDB_G0293878 [Leptopilina boulardi]XP_051175527.1 putative uncharacterized protein DDB_G0293878 [Leptopilina boulardi]XP_051175528.1 putative uncharacterized protein DDB_G0293878 [Leptopilina boulardi]